MIPLQKKRSPLREGPLLEPFGSQTFLWAGEKLKCIFKDLNVASVGTLMTFLDTLVVFFCSRQVKMK